MKNKKLITGFIVAVVLLLVVESYIYINNNRQQKNHTKITFVVTGDNFDNYENMIAGAETAAMDEDCFVDFINSPTEYGIEGEIELLERQLTDGADYIVTVSSDYEAMKEYVNKANVSGKVLFVENGIYGDLKNSIMVDDKELAGDFANYIIEKSKASKLLLVSTKEDINTKTLRTEIENALEGSDIILEYRLLSATTGTINQSMYNLGQSGFFDGFITLDYETLEAAAKAQSKLKKSVEVYSVDNSKEAVYYLDSNLINALAFKDDYSMGFLAVKDALAGNLRKQSESDEKLYYISDKETIHSDKLEKVLFPFVK
ncbi:substrate-binding domain-containing protein [Pseudobutyrivibrio xylanivorans]|uniref:Ribose transport system substrate-binding protein n=1 Tax=Pseudobutyrivibrio xylanivorans DSM 14809 TaxID=1123012 RepID=A0A1M6BH68_PSEXY|nr:substrate-binding domain-containing protein [Pseudobutyrivibrio xylanivorans]SHI48084.1 ribose transport system substrate-binding protein [Pseudobutyrivibrio xylanivorans DSM 14809]